MSKADYPRFCILGAGHGGTAMAAHLSLMGFKVNLYNRGADRLRPIRLQGGVELLTNDLENMPSGLAKLNVVTDKIEEAVKDTDLLMVVVPANGHSFMAEQVAPHLVDGQMIVLHPGRTGGALEVHATLRRHDVTADVIVAEAQTFIYASRSVNPAQTKIFRVKNNIPVAAIPAHRTPEVVKALKPAYPQFVPGDNVMKTSLDNIGAIFHPAVTVLNAARIESTHGEFDYYTEGITSTMSLILEEMDRERVEVAAALGFRAMTAREWLYMAYDAAGPTLYEAMRANRGYDGIKAPKTLYNRYISEDIPMSLVPIASIGDMVGVATTTIKAIIHLGSILHKQDYWSEGRSAERLGLTGLTLKQVRRLILEGELGETSTDNGEKADEG